MAQGPCVFRDSLAEEQVVPEAVAKIASVWRPKTAAIVYGDDNQFTKRTSKSLGARSRNDT